MSLIFGNCGSASVLELNKTCRSLKVTNIETADTCFLKRVEDVYIDQLLLSLQPILKKVELTQVGPLLLNQVFQFVVKNER